MTDSARQFGQATIEVVVGDITTIPVDAIVNAANSQLVGGGGVDGAIHRAGGPDIMRELVDRYGPNRFCPPGSAVITTAGRLPARWVIHAVGPIWRGGSAGEAETLASAYRTSLRLAGEAGASSVSFPAISTGIYGYPADEAARVAVTALVEALQHTPGIRRVLLVAFSERSAEPLRRALAAQDLPAARHLNGGPSSAPG